MSCAGCAHSVFNDPIHSHIHEHLQVGSFITIGSTELEITNVVKRHGIFDKNGTASVRVVKSDEQRGQIEFTKDGSMNLNLNEQLKKNYQVSEYSMRSPGSPAVVNGLAF